MKKVKTLYELVNLNKESTFDDVLKSFQKKNKNDNIVLNYAYVVLIEEELKAIYDNLSAETANYYDLIINSMSINMNESIKSLEKIHYKLNKENLLFGYTLADFYLFENENNKAIKVLNEMTTLYPTTFILSKLLDCYLMSNECEKANLIANRLAEMENHSNSIHYSITTSYFFNMHFDLGFEKIKEFFEDNTDFTNQTALYATYSAVSMFFVRKACFDQAIKLANKFHQSIINNGNTFIKEALETLNCITIYYLNIVDTKRFNDNLFYIQQILLKLKDILMELTTIIQNNKLLFYSRTLKEIENNLWSTIKKIDIRINYISDNFFIHYSKTSKDHCPINEQMLGINSNNKQSLVNFETALNTFLVLKIGKHKKISHDSKFYNIIMEVFKKKSVSDKKNIKVEYTVNPLVQVLLNDESVND